MEIGNISHSDTEKLQEITSLIQTGGKQEDEEETTAQSGREDQQSAGDSSGSQIQTESEIQEGGGLDGEQQGASDQGELPIIPEVQARVNQEVESLRGQYQAVLDEQNHANQMHGQGKISSGELALMQQSTNEKLRVLEIQYNELPQRAMAVNQQLHAHNDKVMEQLYDLIPAWKDTQTMEQERLTIRGELTKMGFSEQEINNVKDPRVVKLLRDKYIGGGSSNGPINKSDLNVSESKLKQAAEKVKAMNGAPDQKVAALFRELGLGVR